MFSRDNLHHAYFIEGESAAIVSAIDDFLKDSFGISRPGNPDVYFSEHDSFGMEEGRALQKMQSLRPILGDMKIFIVCVGAITSEAQNSLLKVFEEPTPGTHFFIISSSQRILLPTLRSRMAVLVHESSKEAGFEGEAKRFLGLSLKERMEYVSGIIEAKEKARAEGFLQSLVSELSRGGLNGRKDNAHAIREILSLIRYVKDRSPSLKLILERAALIDI